MTRIRFEFGKLRIDAELLNTPTARAIAAALPAEARVKTWGEEVYFDVPVRIAREPNARDVVTWVISHIGRTAQRSRSGSAARPSAAARRSGSQARSTCLHARSRT